MTPKNFEGDCKPFRNCSALMVIFQAKPISSENKKLIKESQCAAGEDGKPWVCCPRNIVTTSSTTTTQTPESTTKFQGFSHF